MYFDQVHIAVKLLGSRSILPPAAGRSFPASMSRSGCRLFTPPSATSPPFDIDAEGIDNERGLVEAIENAERFAASATHTGACWNESTTCLDRSQSCAPKRLSSDPTPSLQNRGNPPHGHWGRPRHPTCHWAGSSLLPRGSQFASPLQCFGQGLLKYLKALI